MKLSLLAYIFLQDVLNEGPPDPHSSHAQLYAATNFSAHERFLAIQTCDVLRTFPLPCSITVTNEVSIARTPWLTKHILHFQHL